MTSTRCHGVRLPSNLNVRWGLTPHRVTPDLSFRRPPLEDVNTPLRWERCHSKIVAVSELAIAEISLKLATKKFAPATNSVKSVQRGSPLSETRKYVQDSRTAGKAPRCAIVCVPSYEPWRTLRIQIPQSPARTQPSHAKEDQNRNAPEAVPLPVVSARSCPPLSSQPQPKLDDPKWTENSLVRASTQATARTLTSHAGHSILASGRKLGLQ